MVLRRKRIVKSGRLSTWWKKQRHPNTSYFAPGPSTPQSWNQLWMLAGSHAGARQHDSGLACEQSENSRYSEKQTFHQAEISYENPSRESRGSCLVGAHFWFLMFFCQETAAQVKGLRVVAEVWVLVERQLETSRFLVFFGITCSLEHLPPGILLICFVCPQSFRLKHSKTSWAEALCDVIVKLDSRKCVTCLNLWQG